MEIKTHTKMEDHDTKDKYNNIGIELKKDDTLIFNSINVWDDGFIYLYPDQTKKLRKLLEKKK